MKKWKAKWTNAAEPRDARDMNMLLDSNVLETLLNYMAQNPMVQNSNNSFDPKIVRNKNQQHHTQDYHPQNSHQHSAVDHGFQIYPPRTSFCIHGSWEGAVPIHP